MFSCKPFYDCDNVSLIRECECMNAKNGRNTAGQFSSGNTGRPKGSRNKATIAIESLMQGQAEVLTQTTVTKALEGDSVALRLCMDRIAHEQRIRLFLLAYLRWRMLWTRQKPQEAC